MTLIGQEWRLPLFFLLNAAFFGGLFWYDYTSVLSVGQGNSIGRVIYKQNSLDRKNEKRVVWSSLDLNESLYNKDTIRSDMRSNAILHLEDGSDISLDENTMILLEMRENGSSTIDFRSGSMQVTGSGNGLSPTILASGSEIKVQDSDLRIESEENQKNVNLYVKGGTASITRGEEVVELDSSRKLAMNEQTLSVGNIRVHLIRPEEQEVRPVPEGKKGQVRFSWKKDETFESAVLQVARDRRFESLLLEKETKRDFVDMGLPGGAYYWRVLAKDKETGELEQSAPSRVILVEKNPVELYSPGPDETVERVSEASGVSFRWSLPSISVKSVVEVATDTNFKNPPVRQEVSGNNFSLTNLPDGRYYWRVTNYPLAKGFDTSVSKVGSLRVLTVRGASVPEPQAPSQEKKIHPDLLKKEGVFLSWKPRPEAKSYDLQVSRDPAFQSIIEDKKVTTNYTTVDLPEDLVEPREVKEKNRQDTLVPEKPVYWRVRGVTESGISSAYSPVSRFVVSMNADPKESQFAKKSVTTEDVSFHRNEIPLEKESPEKMIPEREPFRTPEVAVPPFSRMGIGPEQEPVPTFYGPGSGEKMVWPEVEGATSYDVQLKKKSGNKVQSIHVVEPVMAVDLPPGEYEARIRPVLPEGVSAVGWGAWSPVRVFPNPAPAPDPLSAPVVLRSSASEERIRLTGENYLPVTDVDMVSSETEDKRIPTEVVSVSPARDSIVVVAKTKDAPEGNFDLVIQNPGQSSVRLHNAVQIKGSAGGASMSMKEYNGYLASLSYTCGDRSVPDLLIRECRSGYQILKLETRDDYDLYNFLKIKSDNSRYRISGYDYFGHSCPPVFRPAYELLRLRQEDSQSSCGFEEKRKLEEALKEMDACMVR